MLADTHYAVGCFALFNNSPNLALALVHEIVSVSSLQLCLQFFLSGMSALVAFAMPLFAIRFYSPPLIVHSAFCEMLVVTFLWRYSTCLTAGAYAFVFSLFYFFIISDSIYLQFYLSYCDFSRHALPSQSRFGCRLGVAFGSGHLLRVAGGSDPFPCDWRGFAILVGSLLPPWLLASYLTATLSTPLVPSAVLMSPVGPDWFGSASLAYLVAALPSMILESGRMCFCT